jgi:endonuclease/exonuclease/phosphatase (EEP) superfamily protein YafD
LGDIDNPVILAGDFNAKRIDESMNLLKKDECQILGNSEQKTSPAVRPKVEIDFFVLKNFSLRSVKHRVIDERIASDHRPIVADIVFK